MQYLADITQFESLMSNSQAVVFNGLNPFKSKPKQTYKLDLYDIYEALSDIQDAIKNMKKSGNEYLTFIESLRDIPNDEINGLDRLSEDKVNRLVKRLNSYTQILTQFNRLIEF